jgi:hypothetical protein
MRLPWRCRSLLARLLRQLAEAGSGQAAQRPGGPVSISVVHAQPEKGTPLRTGPLYGLVYCLAGVGAGYGAAAVGGWTSVPIWLVAVVLFGAGVWTALWTGGWLLLLRKVKRISDERR